MTDTETIKGLEEMQNYFKFMAGGKTSKTIDNAIKAVKKISHLTDRPCSACEFKKDSGCCKWACVFEEGEE